jgi:hypothetical protein
MVWTIMGASAHSQKPGFFGETGVNDTHQPVAQHITTSDFGCLLLSGQSRQALDVLWQYDRPRQSDKLMISGRLARMGLVAASLDTSEDHPAGTQALWHRIELVNQLLNISSEHL